MSEGATQEINGRTQGGGGRCGKMSSLWFPWKGTRKAVSRLRTGPGDMGLSLCAWHLALE